MPLVLLLAAPMVAVAPWLFQNRSHTPKMLFIVAGLALILSGTKRKTAGLAPMAAFFGACVLSWIFSADKLMSFTGMQLAPYYGLFGVAVVLLAYAASSEIRKDKALVVLEAAGTVVGIFAVIQWASGSSLIGLPMQNGRAGGFRGSPVMLGASLIPCFLAAWYLARTEKPPVYRWAGVFVIVAGMCAAQAKGALLASAVGVWVYETKGAARWLGVAAAWVAVHIYILESGSLTSRERVELVNIAWTSFKQHPLLGWGPDCFLYALQTNRGAVYNAIVGPASQASAHWDLAQVAATLGLAGVGTYLWTLWSLARAKWTDAVGPAVLAAMFIQAQVNPIPTDVLVAVAVILGSRQNFEGTISIPEWVGPLLVGIALTLAAYDMTPLARRAFH